MNKSSFKGKLQQRESERASERRSCVCSAVEEHNNSKVTKGGVGFVERERRACVVTMEWKDRKSERVGQ